MDLERRQGDKCLQIDLVIENRAFPRPLLKCKEAGRSPNRGEADRTVWRLEPLILTDQSLEAY